MAAGAQAFLQAGQLINNLWLKKKFAASRNRANSETSLFKRSARVADGSAPKPSVLEEDPSRNVDILPGLTNDVAMHILARVPRGLYGPLSLVSKAWKEALHSREILAVRQRLGCTEQWLYVLVKTSKGTDWRCWDPVSGKWFNLTPTPKTLDPRESADVLAVDGKVLLIRRQLEPHCSGKAVYLGHFFVQDVCLYDPFTNTWERRTSMLDAREAFAAAVVGSEVVVAGGLTHGIRTRTVESYNVQTDKWTRRGDMNVGRSGSRAAVLDDKLWIFGEQEPQYNHRGINHSTEVYDPETGKWTLEENAWPTTSWPGPLVAGDGRLWMLTRSDVENTLRPTGMLPHLHFENIYEGYRYLRAYDLEDKRWQTKAQLALATGQPHCHTVRLAVMGEKLIVVGAAYETDTRTGVKETRLQVHQFEEGPGKKTPWRIVADGGEMGEGLLVGCTVLSI